MILSFSTNTLVLPSPEFQDSHADEYRRLQRESRGKELLILPKSGYSINSKIRKKSYKFSFLSELDKQQLLAFLDVSIGKEISITDYNSNTYTGIITTPANEISNDARNNNIVNLEIELT